MKSFRIAVDREDSSEQGVLTLDDGEVFKSKWYSARMGKGKKRTALWLIRTLKAYWARLEETQAGDHPSRLRKLSEAGRPAGRPEVAATYVDMTDATRSYRIMARFQGTSQSGDETIWWVTYNRPPEVKDDYFFEGESFTTYDDAAKSLALHLARLREQDDIKIFDPIVQAVYDKDRIERKTQQEKDEAAAALAEKIRQDASHEKDQAKWYLACKIIGLSGKQKDITLFDTAGAPHPIKKAWTRGDFAVHRPMDPERRGVKEWSLTHLPSGRRIETFKVLLDAKRSAVAMEMLGGDWTMKPDGSIKSTETVDGALDVIRAFLRDNPVPLAKRLNPDYLSVVTHKE